MQIQPSDDHRATALAMAYEIAERLPIDLGKKVTKEDLLERATLMNQIAMTLLKGFPAE